MFKSWPMQEAEKIIKSASKNKDITKDYIILETGYGPSGLPHIGTFGEIARTDMIRNAILKIEPRAKCKILCFSDDLDGLRKVPTNVPNQDMLSQYLSFPLTSVPDPFEKYNSFGEHNNHRLQDFLNKFGFDYEFLSSTECYGSGMFNDTIKAIAHNYTEIMNVILPTLREERRKTYSIFLPFCKETGRSLQCHINSINLSNYTVEYTNEKGESVETSMLDGHCKLQWKVDWAMRWMALGVNYEMCGKDLIDSVDIAQKICKIVGKNRPINMIYELFLDQNSEKISKSKGNGISIEDWLSYGTEDSLRLFMYHKPKTAKKLYTDIIPKFVDEVLSYQSGYHKKIKGAGLSLPETNPLFHLYKDETSVPYFNSDISMSLLVNLIQASGSVDKEILFGFINKYNPLESLNQDTQKIINELIDKAIVYTSKCLSNDREYKQINAHERELIEKLHKSLSELNSDSDSLSKDIHEAIYSVSRSNDIEPQDFFLLIYEAIFGLKRGPKLGSFFALYGLDNSLGLINKALLR